MISPRNIEGLEAIGDIEGFSIPELFVQTLIPANGSIQFQLIFDLEEVLGICGTYTRSPSTRDAYELLRPERHSESTKFLNRVRDKPNYIFYRFLSNTLGLRTK